MDNILINTLSQTCKKNPLFAIIFGLFLYVVCSTVLVQLLFLAASTLSGIPYEEMLEIIDGQLNTSKKQSLLRLIQGGSQLLTWGLAAILMAGLMGNVREELRLYPNIPTLFYTLAAVSILLIIPVVQLVTFDANTFDLPPSFREWEEWVNQTELRNQQLLSKLLYHNQIPVYLFNLLVFAIIPAFTEELFFRGFLQKHLSKVSGIHVGIWVTAILFSLFHFQFYGFFSRLLLGALLGYLVYGSGSLFPAIMAHFVFNGFTITAFFQAAQSGLDLTDTSGSKPAVWVSFMALLGLVGVFVVYFRQANTHKSYDT